MSLEVYYPADIRNALLAAEQATTSALQGSCEIDTSYTRGYRDGHRAALVTLALALGLLDVAHYEQVPAFLESLEWEERLSFSRLQHRSRKP